MRDLFVIDGLGICFGAIAIALDVASPLTPPPKSVDRGGAESRARTSAQALAAARHGGVHLAQSQHPPRTLALGAPPWWVALATPESALDPRAVKNGTPNDVAFMKHVRQAALLAAAALAFERADAALLAELETEAIVEPTIGPAMPGYFPAKHAALGAGALLAGLTADARHVAAICLDEAIALAAAAAMASAFSAHSLGCPTFVARIAAATESPHE